MKLASFDTEFSAICAQLPTKRLPALGLDLVDADPRKAIDTLLSPGRRRAFFMNAHCCNLHRRNRAYREAVAGADVLLPDGIGVEMAGRMTGDRLSANLNGTDLVPALLEKAARQGRSVFLFGGKPGTAPAAAARLRSQIPGLTIAGTRDGYQGAADSEEVIRDINESGADIVLVALGVPMQELWLHRHSARLDARLTLAVGALFDFLAGNVTRAPRWVRRMKSEWVWRLAQEPRRLAKRYLAGNLSFLAHAAWRAFAPETPADAGRRCIDVGLSLTALILLSPLLLATAVAIRLDTRGPALFRQTRIGLNGREFTMLKFRSMSTDAEARRAGLVQTSDREGICFKSRQDPRVTRVGRFIRRFSIDELPQIVNVLRGEMSIVGPRPALPVEVAAYPPRALGRLAVKPGLTGIWQVSGRAAVGFDRMVEMDLSYVSSRTLLLDLSLIARTFGAVLGGRGAY